MRFHNAAIILVSLLLLPRCCSAKWTPIRLALLGEHQIFRNRNVIGIDAGLLSAGSNESTRSIGLQITPGGMFNRESYGIAVASLNGSNKTTGLQLGLWNGTNIRGIEIGLVNFHFEPFGCAGQRVRTEIGLKVGIINTSSCSGPMAGISLGVFNTQVDLKGLQLGLINNAFILSGVQLGFINIISSRKGFGRMLPFINASF